MMSSNWSVLWSAALLLGTSAYGESCERLKELSLPDISIDSADTSSSEFKDPAAPWMQPIAVPSHCKVRGTIKPTPDSDIKFEVWLPVEQWNGKLQGNGNGGFAGSINQLGLALSIQRGYAAVSTDTGHVSIATAPDASADLSAAIEAWVEQGAAPSSVRAVKPKNVLLAFVNVKQAGVERSGVLCAYPKHAQWSGKGEAGDAANYTCK